MIRPCTDTDFDAIERIINTAAMKYKGAIPADCWHDPYMTREALRKEIETGVQFYGWEEAGALIGVMGLQHVKGVALIRHAYIAPGHQGKGIGGRLLEALVEKASFPMLVGAWADATWAISFYRRHGFTLTTLEQKTTLLRRYWTVSPRQEETSVVLARGMEVEKEMQL